MLEVVGAIDGPLLLLGKLGEDDILGSDGVLLAHRRKVAVVGLRFLRFPLSISNASP